MNAITPIAADLSPDPSGDRAQTLAERLDAEAAAMEARHLAQLETLAGIGMALAEAVGRRVAEVEAVQGASSAETGPEAGNDDAAAAKLGELGLSFNRITRAVRLTMTLEAHVRDVRRARLLGLETQRAEDAACKAQKEKDRVFVREMFIGRLVEETARLGILRRNGEPASALNDDDIEYEEHEEKEVEDLLEASDGLLRGKAYAGFADRPVSAVVAQVCADLGLTPDWSLWKDEDWAIEEAESVEGSPFSKPGSGGDFEADDLDQQRFAPTPSPSPQTRGASTGPP